MLIGSFVTSIHVFESDSFCISYPNYKVMQYGIGHTYTYTRK